jgi:hypothetical protein
VSRNNYSLSRPLQSSGGQNPTGVLSEIFLGEIVIPAQAGIQFSTLWIPALSLMHKALSLMQKNA